MSSFEDLLNERRTKDSPVPQVKRKKFDVALEKSISVDPDDPDTILIDSMDLLETHNLEVPMIITVPPSQLDLNQL